MNSIEIYTTIELDRLAELISDNIMDDYIILEFILALDREIADYNFTSNLINMLRESIDEQV